MAQERTQPAEKPTLEPIRTPDTLLVRGGAVVVEIERGRGGVVVPMLKDGEPVQPRVVVPILLLDERGHPFETRAMLLEAAGKAADEIERLRAEWGRD